MPPPPNNASKLPFFVLCEVIGVGVVLVGLVYGTWWLVALSACTALGSLVAIRVIRRGENPRWLQAPPDRDDRRMDIGKAGFFGLAAVFWAALLVVRAIERDWVLAALAAVGSIACGLAVLQLWTGHRNR